MAKIEPFCQQRQLRLEQELVEEAARFKPIDHTDPRSIPRVRAVDWQVRFLNVN